MTLFQENWYSPRHVHVAATANHFHMKTILVTFLPHLRMTFNQVSRTLPRHKIKSVGLLPKIFCFLHPVEGWLGTEDTRCIQHNLMMWSGLQWTDHPVYRVQGEKTPLAHPSHKTQQVSNGRMVSTHNIKSVDLLPKKTGRFPLPCEWNSRTNDARCTQYSSVVRSSPN